MAIFNLELKLITNENQINLLNKRFQIAENIYNTTLKYAIKQLKKMRQTKVYRQTLNKYINSTSIEEKKIYSNVLNSIRASYSLSEYGLHSFVKTQQNMYKKHIDSNTSQKIATTVWKAVQDVLFKKGKKLHFKKFGTLTSVEGKTNKSGIKFRNNQLIWNGLIIQTKIRDNDLFIKESLIEKIKYCRITRKPFKNGYKYFLQLVIDGNPPIKRINSTGKFRHSIFNSGRVGLDIGTSTLAVCSIDKVKLIELAPDINKYDKMINKLLRKLDRSKRTNNPNNYNDNRTIKTGTKLIWIKSKKYIKTLFELKNLYRLKSTYIKLNHNKLSNELLSLGNEFYVETMNFKALQKRSKQTTKNKKGKFNKKKRFGKSLLNKAPSMLLTIIERKLNYQGLNLNKVNTIKFRASQYNHVEDKYIKKKLSQRWNKINKDFIQRDLYSAFLLMNSKANLINTDRNLCIKEYDNFKINHNKCIEELTNNKDVKLPISFGIKRK